MAIQTYPMTMEITELTRTASLAISCVAVSEKASIDMNMLMVNPIPAKIPAPII